MGDKTTTYTVRVDRYTDEDGRTFLEEHWTLPGKIHAGSDFPTDIVRHELTGEIYSLTYKDEEGQEHRDDGPAEIVYGEDLISLTWFKHGVCHNESGPAELEQDTETGVYTCESYRINDELHRDKLPALVRRDAKTGDVTEELFFENGKKVPRPLMSHLTPL